MFIRFDVSVKDKIIIPDKLICSIIFNKDFEIGGGSRRGGGLFMVAWKEQFSVYRKNE